MPKSNDEYYIGALTVLQIKKKISILGKFSGFCDQFNRFAYGQYTYKENLFAKTSAKTSLLVDLVHEGWTQKLPYPIG